IASIAGNPTPFGAACTAMLAASQVGRKEQITDTHSWRANAAIFSTPRNFIYAPIRLLRYFFSTPASMAHPSQSFSLVWMITVPAQLISRPFISLR
ncbi:MAG: hypothetical protein VKK99_05725, partial [Cyanobacteriota bacterium]|nr:hypothetical protein [Cyanobacteriota bacterium]